MTVHTKLQTFTEDVAYEVECDGCGKRVPVTPGRRYGLPKGWTSFNSGHNDWGNDSSESHEEHEVCSYPCYLKVVGAVVREYGEYETLVIDGFDRDFLRSMLEANQ